MSPTMGMASRASIFPTSLTASIGSILRGRQKATDGIGLGLAICRSIAEAHGGKIGIESTAGHGTRVSFTLPAVQRSKGKDVIHEPHASDLGGVFRTRAPGGGWATSRPSRARDQGA